MRCGAEPTNQDGNYEMSTELDGAIPNELEEQNADLK